jgi:hypothetical protein
VAEDHAQHIGALAFAVGALYLKMHTFRPDDSEDPEDRRRVLLGHSRHIETPRRLLIEWAPDGKDCRVLADRPTKISTAAGKQSA